MCPRRAAGLDAALSNKPTSVHKVPKERRLAAGEEGHKHDVVLPEICTKRDFIFLPGSPVVVDDVAFAGTLGWYDYSMADPRLAEVFDALDDARGEFTHPKYRKGQWNDVRYACWLMAPNDPDWRKRRIRLSAEHVLHFCVCRYSARRPSAQDLRSI